MSNDKSRVVYADALKIFACFSVVFLHLAAGGWSATGIETFEWNVFNIYDSITRFGVPIFVMVSGMFLLNPIKNLSYVDIYKKYIPRIVFSFLSWSLLYAVYPFVSGKMEYKPDIFMRAFIFGHYHLWYLYMIVGLYIITPLLRKIVQDKKSVQYFILLSVIFAFLLPFTAKLFQLKDLDTFVRKFDVNLVLGYSGYFVGGYYIDYFELSKKTRKLIYMLGILGIIATAMLTYIVSVKAGKANEIFYSYLSPNVLIASIAVFVFFKYEVSKINLSKNILKLSGVLSSCSFRIYLVHDFFNMFLYDAGIAAVDYNPVVSVPLIASVVFALSFATSFIIEKTPVLNKIL